MPSRDPADLSRLLSDKAAADEAALERLYGASEVPDEVIGFHAQQAVEKRIKAVLAAREIAFERTHNIAYLVGLLGDGGIAAPPESEALAELSPWAAQFRYDDVADETADRARIRTLVHGVREWCEGLLGGNG